MTVGIAWLRHRLRLYSFLPPRGGLPCLGPLLPLSRPLLSKAEPEEAAGYNSGSPGQPLTPGDCIWTV